MPEMTYRQFSSDFLAKLKKRRDEFLGIASKSSDVREMINGLLAGKPYAYNYADYINQVKGYRNIYKKLKLLPADISQTHFEDEVQNLRRELDEAFEDKADDTSSMQLLASMIRSVIKGQGVAPEIPKIPMPQKQKEEPNNKQKQELEVIKNFKKEDKKVQYSKPANKQPEKKEPPSNQKLNPPNSARLKTEFSKPQKQKEEEPRKRFESQASMKDLKIGMKIEVEQKNDKKVQNNPPQRSFINGNQLQVQIRYLSTVVDIDGYSYNGFKLKDSLHKYIKKFLKQNSLTVLTKTSELLIMEDVNYIKSTDAGNYRFDPFCDAVDIYLKMKNLSKFDGNFSVKDNIDQIKISQKAILPQEWSKNLMRLTPKSSIADLVDYICNKRQAPELAEKLAEVIIKHGGANIVQDLYGWQKQDFAGPKLQIKPTYIFEIQELIEQIKDNSQINKNERPLKDQQKKCIKNATSHKILRYAVYKTDGAEGVKKIAWLNMENLKNAINIVKEIIYNEELLDQLDEYFNQFALNPDNKPIDFSRGLVLYGPPGTGKTVLTEELPNIIGFHLIEKGLSAADFMKSLVGESSRMIRDLVNRAAVSPYLLCSVGIDEVDGLVPDRKDKDEKNKGEGISMLLSVIGGNKDVSNLVFMTSTNYLKKIDEAIRRRLSGQYQVGRPNPWARAKIIQKKCDYFKNREELLSHLIRITTNFTGAALGSLGNFLLKSLKIKKMKNEKQELTIKEITEATILIARQYSIKLGVYTLPEIYGTQNSKKFLFTERFLERIANRFLIVKHNAGTEYSIMYANQIQRFHNGNVVPIYERQEDKINLPPSRDYDFDGFVQYIKTMFPGKNEEIKIFQKQAYNSYNQYKRYINQFLETREKAARKNKHKRTILIIQDFKSNDGNLKVDCKLFERRQPDLYTIFYLLPQAVLKTYGEKFFQNWAPKQKLDISSIRQNQNKNPNNYTGKIMVELNEQQRMAFQLNSSLKYESKVAFRLFLKSEESISPKAVIPELVDFFTKQNVSYILLIDYQLLLQNDAFQQKKILEVMEEKMMEAKNYQKVAVIINLDSMVMLSQSASDSSMGRSMSYSIQNHNLYQILLNYMRQFAMVNGKISRWMTVVARHQELIRLAKKHLDWPKYPEEIQQEQEQEAKDVKKKCARCNQIFTDRTNQDERKCMQHPGKIIDTRAKAFDGRAPQILKVQMLRQQNRGQNDRERDRDRDRDRNENRFIYACCLKNINEQGCRPYTHIVEDQLQDEGDELQEDKLNTASKWNKVLTYF